MVSRDLDSRFNARETAAVQDWLADVSGAFHVMRDHPAHSIEMLGSGWGVRLGQIERNMVDETFVQAIQDPMFWAVRGAYGPDQGFLKRQDNQVHIILFNKTNVDNIHCNHQSCLIILRLSHFQVYLAMGQMECG